MKVLVIDIGGSHVKLATTSGAKSSRFESGEDLTPGELVRRVVLATSGWRYDVISIGYPGQVADNQPAAEPGNLGGGWTGFDFERAFEKPVRVVNDATLQALGAYEDGRMLFLGLGTGLGAALLTERVVVPLELGELPDHAGGTLGERLGRKGLEERGVTSWRRAVLDVVPVLGRAFSADYIVLGGGNAKLVDPLPAGARRGGNDDAVTGGERLWRETVEPHDRRPAEGWRVLK